MVNKSKKSNIYIYIWSFDGEIDKAKRLIDDIQILLNIHGFSDDLHAKEKQAQLDFQVVLSY